MKTLPLLLAACCLITVLESAAQTDNPPEENTIVQSWPRHMVKFSPLALFEMPYPALQVAYEYRLSWPLHLQHELAWMPPMGGSGLFEDGSMFIGGKVKTELRIYLEGEPDIVAKHRNYVAFEGMYRFRSVRDEGWHEINDGAFNQWITVEQLKQQIAFHFKFGRNVRLYSASNLYMDSYVGVGLRRYFVRNDYKPDEVTGKPDFLNEPYSFVLPSLALGFKLGFGL